MKEKVKRWVMRRLEVLAKKTIAYYKPVIVGVTGSVGKTSTKEAIYAVLSSVKRVRKSLKSYNNEIGVPLTILGLPSGFSSPLRWLLTLMQANSIAQGNDETYPDMLVLEMGSDHPGDALKLMRLAPPRVAVLTAIAQVHMEFFESYDDLKQEESTIVRELPIDASAVLNAENADVKSFQPQIRARTLLYGFSDTNDVYATDVNIRTEGDVGTTFNLHAKGEIKPVFLPDIVSKTHVLSALAAVSVGLELQMTIPEIIQGLKSFEPPPGRLRLLSGIKHTYLIDDSYNSSPEAVYVALDLLKNFPKAKKRIAVLGDMAELGKETEPLHRKVGTYVKGKADILICVGEKARDIARGARKTGMKESHVFEFEQTHEAGKFLQDRMHEGDIVLIKGSQIARLEKVVKEVMAEPEKAETLLVRQETYWTKV